MSTKYKNYEILAEEKIREYMEGYQEQDPTFATTAIHAFQDPELYPDSKPVVPPISLATTFKQDGPSKFVSCYYSRCGNPTRNTLEKVLAALENGKHCMTFSSGMAAINTVVSILHTGDHVVTSVDLYGGANILFKEVSPRLNIDFTFIEDITEPENVAKAIRPNTKLVWIETPTNPLLKVVDIKRVAEIVHQHEGVILAVDNTFLSPYFQRPLGLGADLVIHAATKYINGHSDVLMGAIVTANEELHSKLRLVQASVGAVPSPFECYLALRSLKTLPIRMRQHMKNALAVAYFLESHPCVEGVIHPGLPSHPQHELAKRQSYGHSGMVTFYIKGDRDEICKFAESLKMIALAVSLGGFESLLMLSAIMPENFKLGVKINTVRLSVGLEYVGDIIEDLDQALRAAVPVSEP